MGSLCSEPAGLHRNASEAPAGQPQPLPREQFGSSDPAKRQESIESARINLDLAADLGAGVVRMFAGGGIPKLTDEAAEYIAEAFDEVGDYAKSSGVCPMPECGHDIIKGAVEDSNVIKRVKTSNFGALWNHRSHNVGQTRADLAEGDLLRACAFHHSVNSSAHIVCGS